MRTNIYRTSTLVGLVLLFAIIGSGQNRMTVHMPGSTVLELQTSTSRPPSRIALTGDLHGFWTGNIDRIKDWKPPSGSLPIQAVSFRARILDEKVLLVVSIFTGSRFRENEEYIARYTLSDGDSGAVGELEKYGYVPVKFRVVQVEPTMSNVPVIENRTLSLNVEVAPAITPLPTFAARITNRSKKAVIGLNLDTTSGGRLILSAMPHSPFGKPLIAPGGSYETDLRTDQANPSSAVILHISAVVFEDGSHEGDPRAAAFFLAYSYARRDALIKMIPMLREAVVAAPAKPDATALIARMNADKRPTAPEIVEAFMQKFPNDHGIRDIRADTRFKAASDGTKNDVVEALRLLDRESPKRSAAEVSDALAKYIQHLQQWLDRLPM